MILSLHSALYCPPLKTIGTDISVKGETSFLHTLAPLTFTQCRVMVDKMHSWILFSFFLLSVLHLSVPCHCQTVDQQCHLWRAAKHFTLSHLLMRVCVTVQTECLCSCLCHKKVNLLSFSLFHILPSLTSQSTIKCPTFHSFQVYTSATLKFCLLFFFSWQTTVHKAGLHKTPLDVLGY